jgi:hypothetical protein
MNATQLVMVVIFLVVFGLTSWFFPRPCKHCGRRVIPWNRYVWRDPFGYGYKHFDLHNGCAEQYFAALQKHREHPTVLNEKELKTLKHISEFGRFVLDEAWTAALVVVGAPALVLTESILLAGTAGLLAAMVTRLATMLVLRFMFRVDPQLVKPHQQ